MNINLLKINGFGKIKNKEINLNKNINIIYGKNEQGKTTTLKFLEAMFYGASKNKNGKDISDFEKYKPWSGDDFSGKIVYTLENGETFEVYREFNKKNPKIYNKNGEDISKKFNIDKNKGNEFFIEQTNVDENTFVSSVLAEQKEIILNSGDRRNIIQKISNMLTTGEANISYKKTMDKLNKKYIEEIGSDRTVDRPLNKIKIKIENITKKIKEIEYNEENKTEINYKKNNINNEINNLKNKNNLLKEIKKIKEENKFAQEEINIKNNLINENKNKIKIKEKDINKNKKENKKINKKLLIIFLILFILNIAFFLLKINLNIKLIILGISLIYFLINLFLNIKNKNKLNNKEIIELNNEKDTINKIILDLENDINNLNKKIEKEHEEQKELILKKYKNIIDENTILKILKKDLKIIEEEIKEHEERYNNLKFEKYTLEMSEKNITEKIEEKINLEEQLENALNEEKEILKLGQAIDLTKNILEKSYNKMKNNIAPEFTENLLKNTKGVIGEKYKNIIFNEEDGIIVETENGNYVNANLLSVGTIDQLYLALRLAIANEVAKEKLPIILDEAFAYYDEERLENILSYLNSNFKENQIIIFTCSKREKEIMEKLNLDFNYIEL
ncbi:MAG: ATP-binding protein [Clostridia bacterium]